MILHLYRTRFSFASAANLLGLATQDLDESKCQVSHGETVRETATMISFLTEVIGIRDDLFLGCGHEYMRQVASTLALGAKVERTLPQQPALINLQSDMDHPTQSMSDLIHLSELFGGLDKLKGKKIAVSWAYSPAYGKPMSVPQGLIALLPRFGMEVVLAHPEGYELEKECISHAQNFAKESGGSFVIVNSMEEAFRDADVVYPKSWAPREIMLERSAMYKRGSADKTVMAELEAKCIALNDKHRDWECDAGKMAVTKGGKAHYMHCLPADITDLNCQHGEVTNEVFEAARVETYNEAENKNYVIAAMIMQQRSADVHALMKTVFERSRPRKMF
eukprot:TRINITY_DN117_c0_g1_i4.p1 TRINITY_DN117_c0_g1~~TRINITY_DN117_c0_g1_i4.p1  ORF type:complete len:335 (+),score=58.25 TRINITY_DN117_c0_g1_i4:542-1546(+)